MRKILDFRLFRWWERVLGFLGIVLEPGRFWGLRLTPRFFKIVGGCCVAAFLFALGMAKYSTSPSFCRSCHIMEPYYKAWKTSKHNFVPCVDCHYPPGSPKTILWKKFQALSQVVKYVTRTYSSKPFAEIEDSACLRSGCHSTRLLQGKIITEKGIKFDHKPHLTGVRRGRRLRCVSCHSQIVVGKHVEVTWDTCYLCHFKGTKEGREFHPVGGCLGCHNLPEKSFKIDNIVYNHKQFVTKHNVSCQNCHMDVIRGDGEAPKERCFTCHNQPEKLAKYEDIPLIHENHVTKHNVACFHCHKEMKHGFLEPSHRMRHENLPTDCAKCHLNTHQTQALFYSGKGGIGVANNPSPMYLANVDCIGCHVSKGAGPVEGEVTFRVSEKTCLNCHGKKYLGTLEEAQSEFSETLAGLSKKLEFIRKSLKEAPSGASVKTARKLISRAEKNIRFVRQAHASHNVYYAAQLLWKADVDLDNAGKAISTSLPDLSGLPVISGAFCAKICHQRVGVNVPPESVRHDGKKMPHKQHAEIMSCRTCHSFGSHKSVRFTAKKEVCLRCHEE